MTRILVTGANGFVGRAVCERLSQSPQYKLVASARKHLAGFAMQQIDVGEIDANTSWQQSLAQIDTIIHLAARVHILGISDSSIFDKYREINVLGTTRLAREAAASGVKRLIFMSSIKVNGESTYTARGYNELDSPAPEGPYAISKWDAEQALWEISRETGLEVVIIRPPLVYGPGVKANFAKLLKMVDSGAPMPFGAIRNSRSLIYLGNLVDALVACVTHPAAAGETFLVSDGEDVSTPQLIAAIADAFDRPNRNFSIPISFIHGVAGLLGKSDAVERLTQSLVIDSSKICRKLDWQPPYTMADGLRATVQWYQQLKSK